ncbi:peroxidase N-like [Miscanthus floridulus]|uniref:peroxidase N-like n=1 Tax=Miscanthus floridulus TaxID=154761 RepID=UPI003458905D
MFGLPNINSLRGFEVIDAAMAELENNPACRGKASCEDIVAFAARDAARPQRPQLRRHRLRDAGGPSRWPRVSLKEEAERNLPGPFDTLDDLEKSFAAQGLDPHDMITLSGAHSFGYYKNVHSGKVLFTSDAALNSTDDARKVVDGFARNAGDWYRTFADAMVKDGRDQG